MSTLALIGLGSNLGDRKGHLDAAVEALAAVPGVTLRGVSTYHETAPVGGPGGQGAFLNAAAAVETTIPPVSLLRILQSIESDAGRVRRVHWGERSLDLDLLLCGDQILELPDLTLPHRLLALRRFVLAPLVEIAPDVVEPTTGRSLASLLGNLDRRPSYVAITHGPCRITDPDPDSDPPELRLANRLTRELSAATTARRFMELFPRNRASRHEGTGRFMSKAEYMAFRAEILDAAYWSNALPTDQWLVTAARFDDLAPAVGPFGLVLFPRDRERFLAVRERVLRPTFVVMTTQTRERLSEVDRFVGRDTPALVVDDLDSDATLATVLACCAATRTG